MTTSPVASRCAAPTPKATPATIPTPTTEEAQAFALLEATTASTMAAWYIKRDNIAAARRKLRQALQALNTLQSLSSAT